MSVLFNHGIRYQISDRNPIQLVRQSAKRKVVPVVLTAMEVQRLLEHLTPFKSGQLNELSSIKQAFPNSRLQANLTPRLRLIGHLACPEGNGVRSAQGP